MAVPLGLESELRIGLPDDLHERVAPLVDRSAWWHAKHFLLPKALGGGRIVGLKVWWYSCIVVSLYSCLLV